jgi:protoporphyrinogen oxidase
MSNKIAIIGAGLTGLTCAKLLQQLGFDFLIFESSSQVGGRVRSETIDGFNIDCGFQVLLDSYQAVKRNIDLSKLNLNPFDSGAILGNLSNCIAHPIRHPNYILPTLFSKSFSTLDKAIILRLISQAFFNYNVGNQNDLKEDSTTLDYLVELGLSDKCINEFFKPFFGGVFLDKNLQTTSRMFEFTFGHFVRGRATIPSLGMKQIPLELLNNINPKNLFLNTAIQSISKKSSYVELTDNKGNQVEVNKVIIASDSLNAELLLKNFKLQPSVSNLIESSKPYQHTFCLHFTAPSAPYNQKMIFLSPKCDSAILHLCPITNICKNYSPDSTALISVTSLLPSSTSLEDVKNLVTQELFNLFGQQVSTWNCIDNRLIKFALPKTCKGTLTPWHRTSMIEDGIFLGADYTQTPSINGAMEAAENIVATILNSNNPI